MCFSAVASFSVAGATALVGIATLTHARSVRELPLASFPLLFALQQSLEGGLWLQLAESPQGALAAWLANAFVFIAQSVWPLLAPASVYLVEPVKARRRLLILCGGAGLLVSVASIVTQIGSPYDVSISGHGLQYSHGGWYQTWWRVGYISATAAALLLSSYRSVQALGALVLLGFFVTSYFYPSAVVSVWCFFAATASPLLAAQFLRGLVPRSHPAKSRREAA